MKEPGIKLWAGDMYKYIQVPVISYFRYSISFAAVSGLHRRIKEDFNIKDTMKEYVNKSVLIKHCCT